MSDTISSDSYYDFIIIGTGLSESILSAILSQSKYKVLQIDRADRYGCSLQTYNYTDLCNVFNKEPKEALKKNNKQFNIDYTPKMLLAGGLTRKSLIDFDLSVLVNFLLIPGSYIFKDKLYQVPNTESKALRTGLISFFQKPAVVRFFYHVRSHFNGNYNIQYSTMEEHFEKSSINAESAQIIGHAIALNTDDSYLKEHPSVTFNKIKLYSESLTANNDEISAFIYPLYGASELCQAFVRKAAVAGAVTRLNTETVSIIREKGSCQMDLELDKVNLNAKNDQRKKNEKYSDSIQEPDSIEKPSDKNDIHSEDYPFTVTIKPKNEEQLKMHCKRVISSPLFLTKKPPSKRIVRATLIVEGNIPILKDVSSAQILFLSTGLERKSDVFVLILGHKECVAPKGYKIVLLSFMKENENDNTLQRILKYFGNVKDSFVREEEIYEQVESGEDGWYIIRGNDESMHVENEMQEVVRVIDKIRNDGSDVDHKFV